MLTELHCSCGHLEAIAPEVVKRRMRCKACGATLSYSDGDPIHWFVIGGDGETAIQAVPIPLEIPLKIGSAAGSWIVLPAEIADDRQVDLALKPDAGLTVRHVGRDKAKGTWINQARILSGVLHDGDVLRIGPWTARLMAHSAVLAMSRPVDCDVVVEEEGYEEEAAADSAEPVYVDTAEAGVPRTRTLRITGCIVVIFFAGLYLMRSMIWPGVSTEMPRETTFYCPADGTIFRAAWSAGPPKCPQCGQICLGPIRYKPESNSRKPTTMPKSEQSVSKKPASGGGPSTSGAER